MTPTPEVQSKITTKTEGVTVPTQGRIVTYVDPDGQEWPMIVTQVLSLANGGMSLVVYGTVFSRLQPPYNVAAVAYSSEEGVEADTRHSWHWPVIE